MRQATWAGCMALLGLLACNASSSGGDSSACDEGSEGCDCYPNDTCDAGLRCTEDGKCEDQSSGISSSGGAGSGGSSASGGASGSSGGGGGGDASSGGAGPSGGTGGDSSGAGGSSGGSGGVTNGSGGSSAGGGPGVGGAVATGGSGGITSGSGGSGAGSGGSGAGSGGSSGGSGGTPAGSGVIDDFADCDEEIPAVEGRNGVWYTFASDTSYIESAIGSAPLSENTIWGDESCGAFMNGVCYGCPTTGIGVILNDGVHDLSSWLGIRFTIESAGPVYVAVKTTDENSYGYAWSDAVAYTGSTSASRTVYFADLSPDASFHGLEWAQEIQFTVDDYGKDNGFRLAIHHLELF